MVILMFFKVVSSSSSKDSYISTVAQKMPWTSSVKVRMGTISNAFTLVFTIYFDIDLPNKFELMSLHSFWNQCNTMSCNLLTNVFP